MADRVKVAPPWVRGDKKPEDSRGPWFGGQVLRSAIQSALALVQRSWLSGGGGVREGMTVEEIGEYNKGYDGETGEKVWFEPEPQMEDY